jgi:hypothetical protein
MKLTSSPEGAGPLPDPETPAARVERQVDRVRDTLCNLIEFSGLTRRQVERRLLRDGCGTDIGRLLKGALALKVEHVLAICQVIGIHPAELFGIVFKQPRERFPLLERITALLGIAGDDERRARPNPPPGSIDELCQHVQKLSDQIAQLARASHIATARSEPANRTFNQPSVATHRHGSTINRSTPEAP